MPHRSMTKTELREFKSMLLERTRFLKGDLAGLEEGTRGSGTESAGRESSAPGHTAELASDESERDLSYGRMASQTEELQEIAEALDRIKDGSFGKCEKCEGSIPKERLRAIAYARLCVKCQTKEEQG
jgi:DnaK suppressor protein